MENPSHTIEDGTFDQVNGPLKFPDLTQLMKGPFP